MTFGRLLRDVGDREIPGADFLGCGLGCFGIGKREFIQLLACQMGQARRDLVFLVGQEIRIDRPVFLRLEGVDLQFPLADQAERNGLHPACRFCARQFAP